MRKFIPGPLEISQNKLMKKLGYSYHCSNEKYPCYHRRLTPMPFPRFHAMAYEKDSGIMIEFHFDQDNLHGSSNHDKEWAYTGGRLDSEVRRMNKILKRNNKKRIVGSEKLKKYKKKPGRKSLFNTLLK